MSRPRLARLALHALVTGACMGSDCFPSSSSDTTTTSTTINGPSVEITVDGTHVGPNTGDSGATASLTDQYDSTSQLTNADLVINPSGGGVACNLHFARFGNPIAPFSAGIYTIASPTGASTDDRTVEAVSGLSISANGATLACSGSDCDGGLLSITAIDSAHVEGFVSGNFAATDDGQVSSVVCTFYVDWTSYTP